MNQAAFNQAWTGTDANRREAAMAIETAGYGKGYQNFERRPSLEYHLIFAASFVILLSAAILERLMPWTWMKASKDRRASVFTRAWDAAKTCSAYAFMG